MMLLRTLLTHYRLHPVQALFLLTGIIIANALFTGTLMINSQARASYQSGEMYQQLAPIGQVRHRDSNHSIGFTEYLELRREGFDMLAPLLRQFVRGRDGPVLEILGIDIFAFPRAKQTTNLGLTTGSESNNLINFAFPPYQLWLAPARLKQLDLEVGERIRLPSGELLPPALPFEGQQLGHRMMMDISALQSLTGNDEEITAILVFPTSRQRLADLNRSLPSHLAYIANNETPDPQELTRSFHLNLAAMGLLTFVVGIFLTYNALAFSYTDRRDLIRRLRLAGALKSELARALILELLVFLSAGTLIGAVLGMQLAAWLLPGVGQTLAQLYGVYIAYPDQLTPTGIWLPLAMTALAAGLCVLFPLRETLNAPILERRQVSWELQTVVRRDRLMAATGLLLLLISVAVGMSAERLWTALAGMACLLLGAAVLLPMVLRIMIGSMAKIIPAHNARLSWLLADSRWLLGPASLALIAVTLALVANSGLNTMIHSFRDATDQWLNQRLVADLYLRGQQELHELENWLGNEAPTLQLNERYREATTTKDANGGNVPVEVVSQRNGERFRNTIVLMRSIPGATSKFENGTGIYISERAWRIDGLKTGQSLALCQGQPKAEILGVYRDYGNPRSQWMVSRSLFKACWPEKPADGLSISGPQDTDWDAIASAIKEDFGLEDGMIIQQGALKKVGLAVFDRTFVVTRSLNALTMLVAAIGIFCAISAIHHHRVGQQALLASLGLSRRERGALLLLQWGMLGLLCMTLVWPFGTALAAYLGAVVTPTAFGWSFPLKVEWQHYVSLAALSGGSLMLAVLLPSLRLLRTSPAAMLREQNL